MENLLSRDNQALLAFTDTLYAMQQHKVKQRATDGTESADMYFKEYFKLTRVPPVCSSYIFGFQLVQSKMQWALLQKLW